MRHDLLMGSQDPFFWFLMPLCGLASVGVCVLLNYAALILIRLCAIIATICTFFRDLMWSLSSSSASSSHEGFSRRAVGGPAFATPSPTRRITLTIVLLFLVATVIPYQFAYMVACVVQLATCTRAKLVAGEHKAGLTYNFANYAHSLFVLMLWVLPINLPVLVVWVRNLEVHWLTPFASHHNVGSIMPFILLVEMLTGGTMIPRLSTRYVRPCLSLHYPLHTTSTLYSSTP